MIYSLRGTLLHIDAGIAVIECAGVGYQCQTTMSTLAQLPPVGMETMLFTHMNVREDAVELFGFADSRELGSFRLLTSVTGVGPRVALSILSTLSPDRLALCISAGDVKEITRSNGVGPKLAQRIVLELRDKVQGFSSGTAESASFSDQMPVASSPQGEAVSALVALGYARVDAAEAVARLESSLSVEELIKQGLKALASFK